MPSIKSCEACIHRGLFCNGGPQGCHSCLRGGFICTAENYRDCPVVFQPAWVGQQTTAAEVAQFQIQDILTTHSALITSLTTFYDTLNSMQYLRENEVIRPPQVAQQIDLPALVQSGFEAETIALILHLPQINIRRIGDAEIDILPDGFLPFPYLNLSTCKPSLTTITRATQYITTRKTRGIGGFRPGRALLRARIPSAAEEVIGDWIAHLHSLEWLPSLIIADRKIETVRKGQDFDGAIARARTMQDEWKMTSIRHQRQDYNKYWAQRAIYAVCGWPGQLQSEELARRKSEWTETVQRLHSRWWQDGGDELEEYYRSLAGDRAL
ncbi:hypothetical protein BDV09DRAFT_199888 [Aspergillus tetrazonus]